MQFTQPKSAAASLQEAIARVNASLAAAGFTWALESAYGYTRERRNGQAAGGSGAALVDQVDSWCVVGKVPSKAVSFKVIGKVRELKAHGGFTSVGWRQDKDDVDAHDIIKACPAYQEAAAAYERTSTGNRQNIPFYVFGQAQLGKDVWTVRRVQALENAGGA